MNFIPKEFQEENEKGRIHPKYTTICYWAHFFGPFRIFRASPSEGELLWHRAKAKLLLKWFLLNPNVMYTRDQLVTMLWPAAEREQALRNLHVTIHHLRKQLAANLPVGCKVSCLHSNKDGCYWFEPANIWWTDVMDVQYFYTQAGAAYEQREEQQAMACYRKVIAYASSGFLPEDIYEDLFTPFRNHFNRMYLHALERLLTFYLHQAMLDEALHCAHQALAHDPYCETAIVAIVQTHLQQGNITKASKEFEYFRRLLKQDLDREPGHMMSSLSKHLITTQRPYAMEKGKSANLPGREELS